MGSLEPSRPNTPGTAEPASLRTYSVRRPGWAHRVVATTRSAGVVNEELLEIQCTMQLLTHTRTHTPSFSLRLFRPFALSLLSSLYLLSAAQPSDCCPATWWRFVLPHSCASQLCDSD